MFSGNGKLDRGLPLWRVDPDIRRMVKQTDRYSKKRRWMSVRLKVQQRLTGFLRLMGAAVVLGVLSFFVANASVWTYYHATPITLISVFSAEEALLLDGIRKAGCTDAYVRYTMQGPYGLSRMSALKEYKRCAEQGMEHPI